MTNCGPPLIANLGPTRMAFDFSAPSLDKAARGGNFKQKEKDSIQEPVPYPPSPTHTPSPPPSPSNVLIRTWQRGIPGAEHKPSNPCAKRYKRAGRNPATRLFARCHPTLCPRARKSSGAGRRPSGRPRLPNVCMGARVAAWPPSTATRCR